MCYWKYYLQIYIVNTQMNLESILKGNRLCILNKLRKVGKPKYKIGKDFNFEFQCSLCNEHLSLYQ